MIRHRIDYNGGRGSKRPAAHTQQKLTQVRPPTPPTSSLGRFSHLQSEGKAPRGRGFPPGTRGPRKIARSSHYVNAREKDNFVGK